MATRLTESMEIVARARRIGWEVEDFGEGWKIRLPETGKRVQVHRTPSDVNFKASILRALNKEGFEEQERAFLEKKLQDAQAECTRLAKEAEQKAELLARNSKAVVRAAGGYMTEPEPADFGWALSTDHPAPMARYMLVTPELAEALLERNNRNRPIYKTNVRTFREYMEEGLWRFTHEAVAIDQGGTLQDGQHRLTAIKDSGVAQGILVFVGMPPENFAVIGTGKTRNNADTLGLVTEGDLARKASVVRLVFMYRNIGFKNHKSAKLTNAMCFEMWAADADRYVHALRWGSRIGKRSSIQGSAAAAAAYLLFHDMGDNNEFVEEFLSGLEYRVDERTGDPRGLLHRHMDNAKDKGTRLPHYAQLALIVKTWNMVVADEVVVDRRTHLRWANDQTLPRVLSLSKRSAPPRFLTKVKDFTPTFQDAQPSIDELSVAA